MGFFNNYKNIGLINQRIEVLQDLINSTYKSICNEACSKEVLLKNIANIPIIATEIIDIANNSDNSVKLAPFWYNGEKKPLLEIIQIVHDQYMELLSIIK